jgi:signal transduction histidine kinase
LDERSGNFRYTSEQGCGKIKIITDVNDRIIGVEVERGSGRTHRNTRSELDLLCVFSGISHCMPCVVIDSVIRGVCFFFATLLMLGLCAAVSLGQAPENPPQPELLTNLFQLRDSAQHVPSMIHPFRIIADVIDADTDAGVLVLHDATGVEFINLNLQGQHFERGASVCLAGTGCAMERKNFGLVIFPSLAVENDGIHAPTVQSRAVSLHAGRIPIAVQCFNGVAGFSLGVEYEGPNIPRQPIPSSVLSRASFDGARGRTNFSAGLDYRCYEGAWEFLPDFRSCHPVKTGIVTNFDLSVRSRNENVGLEFTGFISIPRDGVYNFRLTSDDGSRLFVGDSSVEVRVLEKGTSGDATDKMLLDQEDREWMTLEGTVNAVGVWGDRGEFQLRTGNDDIRVDVFNAGDLMPSIAPHGRVSVSGIYQDIFTTEGARSRGVMLVSSWKSVRPATDSGDSVGKGEMTNQRAEDRVQDATQKIATAAEVKALGAGLARKRFPVSIRGVVTAFHHQGAVIQDSTSGVYVDLGNFVQPQALQRGEFCQVDGVTGPGLFSPVIVAQRITHLGIGEMPKPVRASWDRLVNGSLDTEYVEIDGVMTAIRDQRVELLTEGGKVSLDLEGFRREAFRAYENALVRISGCVFANFNMATHRLEAGSLRLGDAVIDVLEPAPRNLFHARKKSIGELLLYDSKATPFRRLQVNGQIIYGRSGEYYLSDGTNGLLVTTGNADQFAIGELVEAVGFLRLAGPAVELKEAVIRKIGSAALPVPIKLATDQLLSSRYFGTLVQLEATLMNQWREGSEQVLELQAGFLAFRARVEHSQTISLPPSGSRMQLTGVYVPQGNGAVEGNVSGFDLLLSSPLGFRVLTTPPWWNLKRVLVLSGILAMLLCVVLIWNKELHRKVTERGHQLEMEVHNRQQAELKHAAEAERSRIARDLHDELGTGLTEVSLLASAGLGEFQDAEKISDRFRAIAEKSRTLVSGLDVIVWAIDPKRNSLESFADYLGGYAKELFSATDIVCHLQIPIECEAVTLSEAARHSLFLAIKEALNNIIRHSAATEAQLQISQQGGCLHVVIADNGRGFDRKTIHCGCGLTNLDERLKALNGQCRIETQPNKGTRVEFIVPLPCDPS